MTEPAKPSQPESLPAAPIRVRPAAAGEEAEICHLVERVFNTFVAPDFPEDGIQEFYRFANPDALRERSGPGQVLLVAEQLGRIRGVVETRQLNHIALLFVENQGQGMAKGLLKALVEECRRRDPEVDRLTVHSSPFAEPIYARMGFIPTAPRQSSHGITFIPMVLNLEGGA